MENEITEKEFICDSCGIKITEKELEQLKCNQCGSTFEIVYEDELESKGIKEDLTMDNVTETMDNGTETMPKTTTMDSTTKQETKTAVLTEFAEKFKTKFSAMTNCEVKDKTSRITVFMNKTRSIVLLKSKKIKIEFSNVKTIKEDDELVIKEYNGDKLYVLTTTDETKFETILSSITWLV